jgi:uncharacterized protein (DUF2267 family)
MEYRHASQEFESFLRDVIDESGLVTRNQAYTMVQAVLLVFRRRLEIRDAIRFANVLPPVLRAIFAADWDVQEPLHQFASIAEMTEEVKAFRRHHNFSPDSARSRMWPWPCARTSTDRTSIASSPHCRPALPISGELINDDHSCVQPRIRA